MDTRATEKQKLFYGYVALIYSLFLLFHLISNFCGRTEEHWRFFYAFTQQSNILVLLWLAGYGLCAFSKRPIRRVFHNRILITALTVYISITFFIVALVLNPVYAGAWQPLSTSAEFLTHNMTPVVMWLYFFIVPGEGTLKAKHAGLVLIYPLLYVAANLLIGANVQYLNGQAAYAYGFINPNSYPNLLVFAGVILGLVLVFVVFGLLLIKLKNRIVQAGCDEGL